MIPSVLPPATVQFTSHAKNEPSWFDLFIRDICLAIIRFVNSLNARDETLPPSKYDQQICLVTIDKEIDGFHKKAHSKGLSSGEISVAHMKFPTNMGNYNGLSQLSCYSRLYIVGHCLPGSDYIDGERRQIHYEILARAIATNAPHLKNNKAQPLRISVHACHAGSNSADSASFCEKLSKALAERGIFAEVQGKTAVTYLEHSEVNGRLTKRAAEPGKVQSKVRFTTDLEGRTQRTVLYTFKAGKDGLPS